uniref:Uncharacterized protein n=2 Tax=Arion vulgaris TaxID=1028688 RepID=A0A0B6ZD99_9EUPU
MEKQDLLDCEQKWKKVVALVPADNVREQLLEDFCGKLGKDSRSRWKILTTRLEQAVQKNMTKQLHVEDEIKLQFCYPRLDVNVSKGVNHLLKSPFCIHPKTGRVCVPMDPRKIDEFDPMTVPTISGLLDELDSLEPAENNDQGKKIKDYKKTSLGPFLEVFETFLQGLESSRKGKLIEQSDIKMEF